MAKKSTKRRERGPKLVDDSHRVVLSKAVMKTLGIVAGDYVHFEIDEESKRVEVQKVEWVPQKPSKTRPSSK